MPEKEAWHKERLPSQELGWPFMEEILVDGWLLSSEPNSSRGSAHYEDVIDRELGSAELAPGGSAAFLVQFHVEDVDWGDEVPTEIALCIARDLTTGRVSLGSDLHAWAGEKVIPALSQTGPDDATQRLAVDDGYDVFVLSATSTEAVESREAASD